MIMNREWLDDTIDRIAQDMTMPAPRVAFRFDVRRAVSERARSTARIVVLAAATASVALAVLLATWPSSAPAGRDTSMSTLASRTLAPVSVFPVVERESVAVVRRAAPPRASMSVAPLSVEPLAIDEMTEVEPLAVKDIAIVDIPNGEPKEYR